MTYLKNPGSKFTCKMKVEISIEELINIYFKKALTRKITLKTAKNDRGHIEHIKMLNESKVTEKIQTLLF